MRQSLQKRRRIRGFKILIEGLKIGGEKQLTTNNKDNFKRIKDLEIVNFTE